MGPTRRSPWEENTLLCQSAQVTRARVRKHRKEDHLANQDAVALEPQAAESQASRNAVNAVITLRFRSHAPCPYVIYEYTFISSQRFLRLVPAMKGM